MSNTWLPNASEKQPGRLDRPIRIDEYTSAQGSTYGNETKAWTAWASLVYASKLEAGGRELFQARQISGEITVMFQIMYMTGLSVKMRIVDLDDGTEYDIERIDEVGRKARQNIWCRARKT